MKTDVSPKFLSVEFHTRFFPALLRGLLRSKQQETRSGFNTSIELYIALTACVVLVTLGVPSALSNESIAGWIAGGVGIAGSLAMIVHSISSRRGAPPSYDCFLIGIFFFFVFVGLTGGIFFSTLEHYHLLYRLQIGATGLIAGYMLGILAGFWMQYLGWLAAILDKVAGLAVLGMLVLDIVLIFG